MTLCSPRGRAPRGRKAPARRRLPAALLHRTLTLSASCDTNDECFSDLSVRTVTSVSFPAFFSVFLSDLLFPTWQSSTWPEGSRTASPLGSASYTVLPRLGVSQCLSDFFAPRVGATLGSTRQRLLQLQQVPARVLYQLCSRPARTAPPAAPTRTSRR